MVVWASRIACKCLEMKATGKKEELVSDLLRIENYGRRLRPVEEVDECSVQ
jgi:hypothetical protein